MQDPEKDSGEAAAAAGVAAPQANATVMAGEACPSESVPPDWPAAGRSAVAAVRRSRGAQWRAISDEKVVLKEKEDEDDLADKLGEPERHEAKDSESEADRGPELTSERQL